METLGWGRYLARCWVVPLVLAWKLCLLVAFSLPIPASDAFFFDGAAVNWIGGGAFVNSTIVRAFPVSGTEFFSAYPPLYQPVLVGWLALFGPSVCSSMSLHFVLFAVFALVGWDLFRRWSAPAWAVNGGGVFLLALTFHDRPDSVAHVFGVMALFFKWQGTVVRCGRARCEWAAASFAVLATGSSLQVGAMYTSMLWLHAWLRRREDSLPIAPLLAAVVAPPLMAACLLWRWPVLGRGFLENLRQTPSLTGVHLPTVYDVLKVVRTTAVLFLVAGDWSWCRLRALSTGGASRWSAKEVWMVAIGGPALVAALASLFLVGSNYVTVAAYPQVMVVGLYLWCRADIRGHAWLRGAVIACALLAGVRAVGLSTWGVVCAVDHGRPQAEARVREVIAAVPSNAPILASSAYLYTLVQDRPRNCYHVDWPGALADGDGALRPACLVLTAFDYHRRMEAQVAALVAAGKIRVVSIEMPGGVPPPDRFPSWQRVLQNVSWAPVIVRLEWHP